MGRNLDVQVSAVLNDLGSLCGGSTTGTIWDFGWSHRSLCKCWWNKLEILWSNQALWKSPGNICERFSWLAERPTVKLEWEASAHALVKTIPLQLWRSGQLAVGCSRWRCCFRWPCAPSDWEACPPARMRFIPRHSRGLWETTFPLLHHPEWNGFRTCKKRVL